MKSPSSQAFNLGGRERIYLDHNATTPLAPNLSTSLTKYLEAWGNPSSIHFEGRGPKNILRETRLKVAQLIQASPLEIIFTSGGSEANNLALKGFIEAQKKVWGQDVAQWPRKQILVSAVEHASVLKTAQFLQSSGLEIDFIEVNKEGQINWSRLQEQLQRPTALVSFMAANNETGTIYPIKELAQKAHDNGALFHTDAVQTIGKMPISVKEWNVDYASFSAHKFYSLKGAGFLYVKKKSPLVSLIHGGGQERSRRAGTENTFSIAAMGCVLDDLLSVPVTHRLHHMKELRNHFENRIERLLKGIHFNGRTSERLPNTSSLIIDDIDGESLLMNLDLEGFAVSTGAACSAGSPEPSPALIAMGLQRAEAQSSLRVSFGWFNTIEQVDLFVECLYKTVTRLRQFRQGPSSEKVGF